MCRTHLNVPDPTVCAGPNCTCWTHLYVPDLSKPVSPTSRPPANPATARGYPHHGCILHGVQLPHYTHTHTAGVGGLGQSRGSAGAQAML